MGYSRATNAVVFQTSGPVFMLILFFVLFFHQVIA